MEREVYSWLLLAWAAVAARTSIAVSVNRTPIAGDIEAAREKRDVDVFGCGDRARHDVADVQCLVRDALVCERPGAAPLDGPTMHLAFLVRHLDVHERVRIAEQELQQLALDLDRAIFEIRGGEGVVCLNGAAERRQQQRQIGRAHV